MIALTVSEQNIHLYWIKGLNKVSNFELKIPGTKNKREFDLLVCDSMGNALYIEFKHFYLPFIQSINISLAILHFS